MIKSFGRFLGGLFCEDGKLSIGRVSFWIVLSPAVRIWWDGKDIQDNHLFVLGFLLVYNSYKKIPMFIDLIRAYKGTDKDDQQN